MSSRLFEIVENLKGKQFRRDSDGAENLSFEGHTAKQIGDEFGFTSRWAERKLQLIRKKWSRELEERY